MTNNTVYWPYARLPELRRSMRSKKHNQNDVVTPQREYRDGVEIISIGLDDMPVTNGELEVLETFAGDLIRMLLSEEEPSMDEEEG